MTRYEIMEELDRLKEDPRMPTMFRARFERVERSVYDMPEPAAWVPVGYGVPPMYEEVAVKVRDDKRNMPATRVGWMAPSGWMIDGGEKTFDVLAWMPIPKHIEDASHKFVSYGDEDGPAPKNGERLSKWLRQMGANFIVYADQESVPAVVVKVPAVWWDEKRGERHE